MTDIVTPSAGGNRGVGGESRDHAGLTDLAVEVAPDTEERFPTIAERLTRWSERVSARVSADPGWAAELALTSAVLILATAVVLATLHPSDMWSNSTPTGGDMGAHVWGPRYLMDHLLPHFRLTGWTPDWYNGFPAYQFYMVIPSLFIVMLTVGLPWYLAVPLVLAALGCAALAWARPRLYAHRHLFMGVAAFVVVLAIPIQYNRSFKLITAIGLIGMPAACWAFAKLSDLPFPVPPLAAVAGLLFVYNREPLFNNTGNIIGGNFQSTMAGEFAFSISLTIAVLYLGVAVRGLRTGKYRALAAMLFALAGLCHLIPAFFVLACTAALFVFHPDRARFKWLATMVPVAGLLTAFWVIPFWWRSHYVNDMGWERLPAPGAELGTEAAKLSGDQSSVWYYLIPPGLRWLLVLAALGVIVSLVRRHQVGLVLAAAWGAVMVSFTWMPQARLWNARLLPFMYLSVSLLAAIGVGELIRLLAAAGSGRPERPLRLISVGMSSLAVAGVLLYTMLPMQGLFDGLFQRRTFTVDDVSVTESSFLMFSTTSANPAPGWSGGNYSGLESRLPSPPGCDQPGSTVGCVSGGWPEYRNLVATMGELGKQKAHGCGRAFWEYDGDRITGYGTPMAPMLLPYWTDGCIGSQEGLYFESSTTVPYHFLMQSELSARPSQPQRGLPYPGFDLNAGVRHLQLLGVHYYLAVSPTAVAAADVHPDLEQVAVSGPWHIYEVADAPVVAPLSYEPVVAEGIGESQDEWLPTAVSWFLNQETLDVPLAAHGPPEWKRVKVKPVPEELRDLVRWTREQLGKTGPMDQPLDVPRKKLPANKVTQIRQGRDSISFTVSRPGVPVLVKSSYFPNWEVKGASRVYRVTPSLMVVVPTSTNVSLHYARTPVDMAAMGMTALGLIGLILLARSRPIRVDPFKPGRVSQWLDQVITIPPRTEAISGEPGPVDPAADSIWVVPDDGDVMPGENGGPADPVREDGAIHRAVDHVSPDAPSDDSLRSSPVETHREIPSVDAEERSSDSPEEY